MRKIILSMSMLTLSLSAFSEPLKNWNGFIEKIESGDNKTLNDIPKTLNMHAHEFNDNQSIELSTALSIALIKNPLVTLAATDKLTKSKDILVKRFSSVPICWLPIIMEYSKKSTLLYYKLASESLKNAGLPARECLKNMRASFEEVAAEEERGTMKWGKKEFTP